MISQLERDIALLQNGLKLSEDMVREGNEEMDKLLRGKILNRDALATANNKVTIGRKRKEELEKELQSLENKKRKIV